jgi:hypothetical protein
MYMVAAKAVFGLQDREAAALAPPDLTREYALLWRDELKRSYIQHVAEHGC